MNIFLDKHIDFLRGLINAQVIFLLVGGYAVHYYGYRRSNGDLELWIKPDNLNKIKLIAYLTKCDFDEQGIAYLNLLNFEEMQAFHFDEEPERIDFLTHISGVKWEEAWPKKMEIDLDGILIPVIHKNDLIASKMHSGRAQDIADIEGLQNVNPNK